ncbi:MAG TPA: hypothetical protein VJG48_01955 [Candidatus Paceibacterota bacterium]
MYLKWGEEKITDWSEGNTEHMYAHGFVFTRLGKGVMQQTRSLRVDLTKFELSSENRRVLRKTDNLLLKVVRIPDDMEGNYDWKIAKMAKDFYTKKFGEGTFSANKIKSLILDRKTSNFSALCAYTDETKLDKGADDAAIIGWAICYQSSNIFHYAYPFYDLNLSPKEMGMGMMIRAIDYAKSAGKQYFYMGSANRPTDTYKLQFTGIEWWDGSKWQTDLDTLRGHLRGSSKR